VTKRHQGFHRGRESSARVLVLAETDDDQRWHALAPQRDQLLFRRAGFQDIIQLADVRLRRASDES